MCAQNFDDRPAAGVGEQTLRAGQVQVERKTFHMTLKENRSGRFLRIVEQSGDRRNSVIVPASGFKPFYQLIGELIAVSDQHAPAETKPEEAGSG